MAMTVSMCMITQRPGLEFFLVKVPRGAVTNQFTVDRLANELRAKVPVDKLGCDVVFVDAEPSESSLLMGTNPNAVEHIRSLGPRFYRWQDIVIGR